MKTSLSCRLSGLRDSRGLTVRRKVLRFVVLGYSKVRSRRYADLTVLKLCLEF